MADPKPLRERSDFAYNLQTIQTHHDVDIEQYQHTIDDLVKKQKDLEQKNISLETSQMDMVADIKLLKMVALGNHAATFNSRSDLDIVREAPSIITRLRQDLDVMKDKIKSLEISIDDYKNHPRDLIEQDATLEKATQDIATLPGGLHRHESTLGTLDPASRGLPSNRISGLQQENPVQNKPNIYYEIQNQKSNGIRNRQVVCEILSDDEQLDTINARDLVHSHMRDRGRFEEITGYDEILADHKEGENGNYQQQPPRKRLKTPLRSDPTTLPTNRSLTAIKIWIDDAREIQTDGTGSDQDDGWQRLQEIWKGQVEKMNIKNPGLEYLTVDLRSKCLHSVGTGPTAHFGTKSREGQFTCRMCANTGRLCFVRIGGRLEALPLPALSEHQIDRIDDILVVKEDAPATVSRHYPEIWSD